MCRPCAFHSNHSRQHAHPHSNSTTTPHNTQRPGEWVGCAGCGDSTVVMCRPLAFQCNHLTHNTCDHTIGSCVEGRRRVGPWQLKR
jgi:hypothetical protein